MFSGQQLQSSCILGRKLRDKSEGMNIKWHEETVTYLREVPVPLCGLDYVMNWQSWRLLDLYDGGGQGFTIGLFFLALRHLSPTFHRSSRSFSLLESNWKKSKNPAGTQRILVDLLCDLVIQGRGIFSDFSYPPISWRFSWIWWKHSQGTRELAASY